MGAPRLVQNDSWASEVGQFHRGLKVSNGDSETSLCDQSLLFYWIANDTPVQEPVIETDLNIVKYGPAHLVMLGPSPQQWHS